MLRAAETAELQVVVCEMLTGATITNLVEAIWHFTHSRRTSGAGGHLRTICLSHRYSEAEVREIESLASAKQIKRFCEQMEERTGRFGLSELLEANDAGDDDVQQAEQDDATQAVPKPDGKEEVKEAKQSASPQKNVKKRVIKADDKQGDPKI